MQVRVATSAYGLHVFGKVKLPEAHDDAFIHIRVFVAGETVKLHCIHTEEVEEPDGNKRFRAIFAQKDALEWFDT